MAQPAIYYGEEELGYRIVNSGVPEFDYPSGDENVYTRYDGHGDVVLDSWLKRLVFAWQQFDISILISDYVRADSRIQLWRQIQTRIAKLAPFLMLDHDPYLVVDGGRLFWIQDAYTTGERYPYAEPAASGVSYIRNSVKVVVDAYQGDVTFYAIDPQDPVLRVYAGRFPRPVPADRGDAGRAGRPSALSRGSVRPPVAKVRHLPHDRAACVLQQRGPVADAARDGRRSLGRRSRPTTC